MQRPDVHPLAAAAIAAARIAAGCDGVAAVYAAEVPFKRPGRYAVLALTKVDSGLAGALTEVEVSAETEIPEVGKRPPPVDTDTVADVDGDLEMIDTRVPPAPELHEKSFRQVLDERPVALLFATPQLCQSRVCGPVVDIALQLEQEYGDEMTFIHQEVYIDDDPAKGLRQPLRAFELQTEPWLFTVDADGKVAARLEGSFGLRGFEQAVQAALR